MIDAGESRPFLLCLAIPDFNGYSSSMNGSVFIKRVVLKNYADANHAGNQLSYNGVFNER
jgi:hypothetical protein